MTDKVQLIKEEIERLKNEQLSIFSKGENDEICGTALICIGVYNQLLSFINSFSEEPTSEDTCLLGHDYKNRDCENCSFELCKRFSKPASEDLEEAAKEFGIRQGVELKPFAIKFFKAGAEWQKQQMEVTIEFECIGKKIKMTIQELIDYYIDSECCAVAD